MLCRTFGFARSGLLVGVPALAGACLEDRLKAVLQHKSAVAVA